MAPSEQFKIKEQNHARWNKQTKKHKKEKGQEVIAAVFIVLISLSCILLRGRSDFLPAALYSFIASICYLIPFYNLGAHYYLAQSVIDAFIAVLMYMIYRDTRARLAAVIIYFCLASICINFVGWSLYTHTDDGAVDIYNNAYLVVYIGILIAILTSKKNGDRRNYRRVRGIDLSDFDNNLESELARWTKNTRR